MRNNLFPDSGGHMYEKDKLVYDLWHLMDHLLEMNREMYLSFQEEASSAMYVPFIRRNLDGVYKGMEPDMAKTIAQDVEKKLD